MNIDATWKMIDQELELRKKTGEFERCREQQKLLWLKEHFQLSLFADAELFLSHVLDQKNGNVSSISSEAKKLLQQFYSTKQNKPGAAT
jgi:hypothetical protein